MITVGSAQLWVHDQDAALEFWTKRVGFEVRSDVTVPEMGNFRWLVVGAPSQPDFGVVLMAIPGPPIMDPQTQADVADLMGKGFAGTVFLVTEDCQASYEELSARGVEFVDKPTVQPYGKDAAFRDPSGNNVRLTEVYPTA
ncbi:MAG: VOC family protein [Actinomycetota bacterium]|nr:MAG: VOC family protein [Actinomycetota bacterium]